MENSTYKKYIYIFYFPKCKHIFYIAMGAMFLVLFIYICWSCRKLHNSSETNRILHTAKYTEKYSKNAKKGIHWERFYFTYINNTKLSMIWGTSQKPVKCSLPFDRSYVTDRLSIPCEIQWFPYWKRCDKRMQYSCMKGVQFQNRCKKRLQFQNSFEEGVQCWKSCAKGYAVVTEMYDLAVLEKWGRGSAGELQSFFPWRCKLV